MGRTLDVVRAGADGLFIEAPVNVDELERIGRAFDVPQLANMLEGGRTPFLTPADLEQPGFRLAIYGISLLTHAAQAMQRVLTGLVQNRFRGQGRRIRRVQINCGLRALGRS